MEQVYSQMQYGVQSDDGYEPWGSQLAIAIPQTEIARLASLARDEENESGLVEAILARLTPAKERFVKNKTNLVIPYPELALAAG